MTSRSRAKRESLESLILHQLLFGKRDLSREMLVPPSATADDARRLYEETVRQ